MPAPAPETSLTIHPWTQSYFLVAAFLGALGHYVFAWPNYKVGLFVFGTLVFGKCLRLLSKYT